MFDGRAALTCFLGFAIFGGGGKLISGELHICKSILPSAYYSETGREVDQTISGFCSRLSKRKVFRTSKLCKSVSVLASIIIRGNG